jgi:hypothetical protein
VVLLIWYGNNNAVTEMGRFAWMVMFLCYLVPLSRAEWLSIIILYALGQNDLLLFYLVRSCAQLDRVVLLLFYMYADGQNSFCYFSILCIAGQNCSVTFLFDVHCAVGWVDFGLFHIFNKITPKICYIPCKSTENRKKIV